MGSSPKAGKTPQKPGERGCLSPKTLVIKVLVTEPAVYTAVLAIFFQLLKISPSRGLAGRGGVLFLQLTGETRKQLSFILSTSGPPQPVSEQRECTEMPLRWEGNGCSQMRLTPRTGSRREAGARGR